MRNIEEIIKDLNNYSPVQDEWRGLDEIIAEAAEYRGDEIVRALLNVLERFPTHDGYGVFWSIVHALEAIGDYEAELVSSISMQPHEMSVLMLNRLINGGVTEIGGKPIIKILKDISNNEAFSEDIREQANGFIEYQESCI